MALPKTSKAEHAFLRGGGALAELIDKHDWTSTPLGPLEAWPAALKAATSMILNSPLPMALLLGEDAIAVYNDAYAELIGPRHPSTLGGKSRENWPELAEFTGAALKAAWRGEHLSFRDLELSLLRKGVPEQAWMNIDLSPVRDENGDVFGVLCATVETTARVLAERKAALQIDRLRNMFDQAPGFISLVGGPPDYVIEYVNEAHRQTFGERGAVGRRYVDVFPENVESGCMLLLDVYVTGRRYLGRGLPISVPTPGGGCEERFVDLVLEPLKDERGEVSGVFFEGFDVTPAVRAQQAAETTARRLSAAVAVAQLGTFELTETGELKLDERAREIFGFGPEEPVTVKDMVARVDSEDYSRIKLDDATALATGHTRRATENRIRLPDGSIRHVITCGDLTAGPDGAPLWSAGLFEDVTERRRAEQRQQLLINELNHRVKNTLATVQSIAAQTLRSGGEPTQIRAAFEGRLTALSAAHVLLTAQSWRGARLDALAASTLAPFEAVQKPQIVRAGPPVWLGAPHALALSLALHELATNSSKYGALAVPEGWVSLSWKLCAGELAISWSEQHGPPAASPGRSGFGMRLLQHGLPRELGGRVALDFAPDGLTCEIRFPLADRDGVEADAPASSFELPAGSALLDLKATPRRLVRG